MIPRFHAGLSRPALRPLLATAASVSVVPLALAQGSMGFDLVEINKAPGPDHPGFDSYYNPVGPLEAEAGGVCTVDFNNDGFIDIFVPDTEGFPSELWVNQGDGTFVEEGAARGVAEPNNRRGFATFFDMENDGDLDLLSIGYPELTGHPNLFSMFKNTGAPAFDFKEVTHSAGGFPFAATQESTTKGDPGGVCTGDFDGDGYTDVFITWWMRLVNGPFDQPRLFGNIENPIPDNGSDFYSPRKFVDRTIEAGFDIPFSGSLADAWIWVPSALDFNRDGYLDIRMNLEWSLDALYINDGTGSFFDVAEEVGYAGSLDPFFFEYQEHNEMGQTFGDPDLDGDLDSYHTNDSKDDCFYRNDSEFGLDGKGLAFVETGEENDLETVLDVGWGCRFADMDLDGDEDLLIARGMSGPTANYFFRNDFPLRTEDGETVQFTNVGPEVADFTKLGDFAAEQDIGRGLVTFDYDNDGDLDALVHRQGPHISAPPQFTLVSGLFENQSTHGRRWLELDLRGEGGSFETVGSRVYTKTGGIGGEVQMRVVFSGDSFLNQNPFRVHFGLGNRDANWLVVRWLDGRHTVVPEGATSNQILSVERGQRDDTGDLDGDGVVNYVDVLIFNVLLERPTLIERAFPLWPSVILADANGDGTLDALDLAIIQELAGFQEISEVVAQPN